MNQQAIHFGSPVEERQIGDATVPWLYSTHDAEYAALRHRAALLDHSALGLLKVTGEAIPFLQTVLARDVEFLTPDRCLTSLLLDESGSACDVVTVYLLDDHVLLETAAGRGTATLEALRAAAGPDVAIESLADEMRLIGVEGPYAWGAVGKVLNASITALPYESVTELDWGGTPLIFARSGFTAEYGYKVFAPSSVASDVWAALAEHATPVGQQVLETAMLEVRQPVLHLECTGQDVLEAGLGWLVDFSKDEFRGRQALMDAFRGGTATLTVGFSTEGIVPLVAGDAVYAGDERIGVVSCITESPGVGGLLGLARVEREFAASGLRLGVVPVGSAVPVEVETLASPYVVPSSWSTPIL